jgi:hypothetical protein
MSMTGSAGSGTHAPLRAVVVIEGGPQTGKNLYLRSDAQIILHSCDAALNIVAAESPPQPCLTSIVGVR